MKCDAFKRTKNNNQWSNKRVITPAMNHSYTNNLIQLPSRTDDDPVVILRLPYADPYRQDMATVTCNQKFWNAHAHLKWIVLPLSNEYAVVQNPLTGLTPVGD